MLSSCNKTDVASTPPTVNLSAQIERLEGLPPFPDTAMQILAECKKPEVDTNIVIQLMECDPAVGVKVLNLANSPLYGGSRAILSIGHAVVVLGFRTVSQIAVSIAAGDMFANGDPAIAEIRKSTFKQSLACATSARIISRELSDCNPDEGFMCGIMQDIGKLVFLNLVQKPYCEILKEEPKNSTQLEEQAFGITHPNAGNICTTYWGLPAQINLAIRNHHLRFDQTKHPLSKSVIAASHFASQWETEPGSEVEEEVCLEFDLGLTQQKHANMRAEYLEQYAAISEICAL